MNVMAFVGKIHQSPRLRESVNGNKYAVMEVAVPRPFPNSDGHYETDYLTVTLWRGIAETTSAVASEGDLVAIKGRIQSHNYEASDGTQRTAYDLIAEHVHLLNQNQQSC